MATEDIKNIQYVSIRFNKPSADRQRWSTYATSWPGITLPISSSPAGTPSAGVSPRPSPANTPTSATTTAGSEQGKT